MPEVINWKRRDFESCLLININYVLIEAVTKFSNVIGYQQPDLATNRIVYVSCFIGQCNRAVYALFACITVVHFVK